MASGVQVDDKVKDIISDMKVVKSDADASERIRLVVLEIKDGFIIVEKVFKEKDLSGEADIFKFFLSLLEKEKCRYVLYDCHFENKESSKKEELVFVMWAPETAPIKSKMQYASSKDSLKKVLTGIKHELQMNDLSDYGTRDQFAERISRNVISVEGHPVGK
ncbi:non-muscle cofilin 1-like [Cyprinodon tularosa]|uniref:Cofilin-2-like n=1 Tax=Cyprinodon variegatus TaxID=28743 RepID=A0A3Q2D7M3_CYPVA|nr:PREDICTED: cofilin-2-like [Cyprinodon variegatus]XP_038162864.1 non-muscle cofilin 1-like [Cyprinodon tularosa]